MHWTTRREQPERLREKRETYREGRGFCDWHTPELTSADTNCSRERHEVSEVKKKLDWGLRWRLR